uniref:Uncharacterized protein n=1 Tax=Anopheles quadriannulatus TaxID=34691 RepID=A0A182WYV1_ANOQN
MSLAGGRVLKRLDEIDQRISHLERRVLKRLDEIDQRISHLERSNLNGLYRRSDPHNATMNWFGFRDDLQGLKEATMMIREVLQLRNGWNVNAGRCLRGGRCTGTARAGLLRQRLAPSPSQGRAKVVGYFGLH